MKENELEELILTMFRLNRSLRKIIDYRSNDNYLSAAQFQALIYIKEHFNPTMSDLSNELNIALPTTTNIVDRLVDNKLLTRYSDDNDRRIIRLQMTKKGDVILEETVNNKKLIMEKVLSFLPKEDLKSLQTILHNLINRIDQI